MTFMAFVTALGWGTMGFKTTDALAGSYGID